MDMATNMDLLWNLDRPNQQITIRSNYSGDHVRVVDPKNNSDIFLRLEVSCPYRS